MECGVPLFCDSIRRMAYRLFHKTLLQMTFAKETYNRRIAHTRIANTTNRGTEEWHTTFHSSVPLFLSYGVFPASLRKEQINLECDVM